MRKRLVGASLLALAASACRLGDLVSTPHSAPAAPVNLAQTRTDGTTPIPTGQYTPQGTVMLWGRMSDPDAADQIVLQVEVRAVGIAFADTATAASASVPTDSVASVTLSGLADNAGYHWQARAVDQTGRASPWVSYGRNAESAGDFGVDAVAEPPAQPASLAQLKSDGSTAIAVGATTDETTVIFQAAVSDPDPGDSIRLQVERQPLGTTFSGTATGTSTGVPSGGAARVTVSGQLVDLSYHWQARAMDRGGQTSAWVSFGGNPEVQADYRIEIPAVPNAPSNLGQFRQNGQTAIAVGDTTTQTTVVFKGTVTDPNSADQIRLEVEVREVGVAFSDTATAPGSALVANGAVAQVSVTGLQVGKDYHWQARAVDQTGRASPWVAFGGNAETDTDFGVR
jgi:predicted phage tail protein